MPDTIQLRAKVLSDPQDMSDYRTAKRMMILHDLLSTYPQKTVSGAMRANPVMNQLYSIRFARDSWAQKYAQGDESRAQYRVWVYETKVNEESGRERQELLVESSVCFTMDQKDNRLALMAWLAQEAQNREARAVHSHKGSVYLHRFPEMLGTWLGAEGEEMTVREFFDRKERLACYLESCAHAIRRLTPETGKYQFLPSGDEPETWIATPSESVIESQAQGVKKESTAHRDSSTGHVV